uniref:IRG-type G domain-containing protein n=1 Tax=Salvator merianae TaxID=96440 RepID=A0A8D0BDI2_SALMN
MEEFREDVKVGYLRNAVSQVLEKPLPSFASSPLYIAVVGEPGSGKSSIINALRGLDADDPGAAETGIHAATTEVKDYPHPNLPQVILWDLPGIGAAQFTKKVELKRFDFFIIVGSQRFRSTHADLVHEIQEQGKRFYFVRTKADLDLAASKRQRPSGYSEEKVLQQIKQDCMENLKRLWVIEPQVFIVSNMEPDKFDFPLLQETLKNHLLKLKKQAFLLSLPESCSLPLEKKKESKQKDIWLVAICSALAAFIPVPGFSFVAAMVLFLRFRSKYHHDFGLDDSALAALAQLAGKEAEYLKASMKSVPIKPIILWRLPDLIGTIAMIIEYCYGSRYPVIGCVLSVVISLVITYLMLQRFASDVVDDTKMVLTKVLKDAQKETV